MITQAIKRWLSNLFAWWPWKRTPTSVYAPLTRNGAMTIPQEHLWHSSNDGSLPQSGLTSVAVEQGNDDALPDTSLPLHSSSIENANIVTQSQLKDISPLPLDEKDLENVKPSETQPTSVITPTPEQQMAFLRYLVNRGLLNEGFEEGQIPEQYRQNK